ncbi:hypothetical protein [Timonella senegalensis]|uniref:hypothetical protein n=1 Tax=Timonella senegalensis TaxID=1465825 RepID=UPI000317197F|nr:hypothetical protein [Timonella senegalensis]
MPTAWQEILARLPKLADMKTERPLFVESNRRATIDPSKFTPLNLDALGLELELRKAIDQHCEREGTATDLAELLASGYPVGQSELVCGLWNREGVEFLEEIRTITNGEVRTTARRRAFLEACPELFRLNLYQMTQALVLMGFPAKYNTLCKWAQRGHLIPDDEGRYSLSDALARYKKVPVSV